MSEQVKPGTRVRWESQSQSWRYTKEGEVLAFLPAGQSLTPWMHGYPKSRVMILPSTYVSSVDRYVVRVDNQGNLPRIYAPLAAVIEAAARTDDTQQED